MFCKSEGKKAINFQSFKLDLNNKCQIKKMTSIEFGENPSEKISIQNPMFLLPERKNHLKSKDKVKFKKLKKESKKEANNHLK